MLEIVDHIPYVKVTIKNINNKGIVINSLVDTWFSWSLAIPYFEWKNETISLINKIDLLSNQTKPLPEKEWLETASWISKTYSSLITIKMNNFKINSEVLIYKHSADYQKKYDGLVLWMKFIEENNLDLVIKTKNSRFSEYYLK